ncbi:MAG TPA: 1,6-anhydro-N-acetylmuramyl-L-alanine amidase AmpD [Nevskiaceae bacterium]|nr:1,6-anhydro-N-acetylmuramyl-L-alanine amidase AmpD [Nevskiaceae bacterium]
MNRTHTAWTVDGLHWLQPARHRLSPHCDERPPGSPVDLLVIHAISLPPDRFGGPYVDDLFMGTLDCDADPYFEGLRGLRVSAHLLIDRRGALTQYVPFHRRAWHAGASEWRGRSRCNDFSIGIELEGSDHQPFTPVQMKVLVAVSRCLLAHYRIPPDQVAGHSEIAPGRKTDPGPYFDWAGYRAHLLGP